MLYVVKRLYRANKGQMAAGGIYISSPYARHVKVPVTCPGMSWLNLKIPNQLAYAR